MSLLIGFNTADLDKRTKGIVGDIQSAISLKSISGTKDLIGILAAAAVQTVESQGKRGGGEQYARLAGRKLRSGKVQPNPEQGKRPILIKTGRLLAGLRSGASIETTLSSDGKRIGVTLTDPVARLQSAGLKARNLPARPVLNFNQEDAAKIGALLNDKIADNLRKKFKK